MRLEGTPSDQLPRVLATGTTDIRFAFVSFSGRHPEGRDAEYLAWHTLDHRPEQHRLPELRQSLRIVSTPACRAARAASEGGFDSADHVMTYLCSGPSVTRGLDELGAALLDGGRVPFRLPHFGYQTGELAGKAAAARAVAGADVIPWRPATGVYLIVEEGHASPEALVEVPGVAATWWYHGVQATEEYGRESPGRQITYCYLDDDPVATAERLREPLRRRWADGPTKGLLAAPFQVIVPFDWTRHLPA